ncbi:MAG TPA: ATP-binding protein [Bryobacteraceae bacterium]|nr:ATP-binding protein [Bryobacteraceae bacterium]
MKTDTLRDVQAEFLASLNHELRTPLSGILGMTDLLLETSLTEDQREYAGATRVCAESLLEILNVTLEYSALTANQVRLEEVEFSARDTLQGVVNEFGLKAQVKGLRMTGAWDASLPEVAVGDPLRLRQILWHLVGNAVKFTREGQVEVRASAAVSDARQTMLTIEVRDTGIGILPEQLNRIFESFRQIETGLSRSHGGLGLGLAVTQKLVELLDGTILVVSELGRGSVFTVHVPLRVPSSAEARPVETRKSRGRVLVIDDNSVAQTIASHALRRQSYEVQCAGDGLEALDAASKSHFDVILMDLQMPGWDGFETAARIRQLADYRETPIIAVTANCSDENRARCASCGMQDFLAKPVRTRDLVQAVEKYLEQEAIVS